MCTRVFNNGLATRAAIGGCRDAAEILKSQEGGNLSEYLSTGRNMDWAEMFTGSFWAFKPKQDRQGVSLDQAEKFGEENKPLAWTSQYGSVVMMVADSASSDGINTEGLVANLLYLADTEFADIKKKEGVLGLSILRWVQFVLDSFATVQEVVDYFEENRNRVIIVDESVPNPSGAQKEAKCHLSVSDASGDSAIIEICNGEYQIYHKRYYKIMTNQPGYATQIVLNQFWQYQWDPDNSERSQTIPGAPFADARFARASYYTNALEPATSINDSIAQTFSVMANASIPVGFKTPDEDAPNNATTIWTNVAAHKELLYYYRNTSSPNTVWADMKQMNLSDKDSPSCFVDEQGEIVKGAQQGKVTLVRTNGKDKEGNLVFEFSDLHGDVSAKFIAAENPYGRVVVS